MLLNICRGPNVQSNLAGYRGCSQPYDTDCSEAGGVHPAGALLLPEQVGFGPVALFEGYLGRDLCEGLWESRRGRGGDARALNSKSRSCAKNMFTSAMCMCVYLCPEGPLPSSNRSQSRSPVRGTLKNLHSKLGSSGAPNSCDP